MTKSASAATALVLLGALVAPASALTDQWADWTSPTGSSNAYTATLNQVSPGFPAATMATDSRGNIQVASGASTFLSTSTPPGAKYGSSRNRPYLVLRPRADTPTAPSTTTYTFDRPTPEVGWAFVLGDVDADAVRVAAVDAAGDPVPAARVNSWFQGTFNYASGPDLPTWDPGTATLTGNAGAVDTDGAAGWFEPDLPLSSLTLTFTRRAGFPVYQTWFVSRARPLGGMIADVSTGGATCPVAQSTLTLLSPYGDELATTQPAADGNYSFGEFATQSGYTVRLDKPATCAVRGSAELQVSNVGNDGDPASRADFEVRAIVPHPISGTVRDDDGNPVAGVEVTLTAPGGGTIATTTTTTADGSYLFDDNQPDEGYTVSIAVPSGHVAGPDGTAIPDIDVVDAAVTGQDFVVVGLPAVAGVVTGGGASLGGVQVIITPAGGGPSRSTVTTGDGSYSVDGLPPGDYEISIVPPEGYTGPTTRAVTVGTEDLTGQDFALGRPGALAGTVTERGSGSPQGGVVVTVDGPDGQATVVTDDEGGYYVGDLPPGTYAVRVTAPEGSVVVGTRSYTVIITSAGEIVGARDFVVDSASTPSPPPDESETPSPPPGSAGGGDADLPDVGGPGPGWGVVALASLLAGLVLVGWSRRRQPESCG